VFADKNLQDTTASYGPNFHILVLSDMGEDGTDVRRKLDSLRRVRHEQRAIRSNASDYLPSRPTTSGMGLSTSGLLRHFTDPPDKACAAVNVLGSGWLPWRP